MKKKNTKDPLLPQWTRGRIRPLKPAQCSVCSRLMMAYLHTTLLPRKKPKSKTEEFTRQCALCGTIKITESFFTKASKFHRIPKRRWPLCKIAPSKSRRAAKKGAA